MRAMTSWLVLQLADSAFPTGGFAHPSDLEVRVQAGELASLERFCTELIDRLAQRALPIAGATWDHPERLAELDAFTRTTLCDHAGYRASRAQGRALLDVAARGFGHDALVAARASLARPGQLDGHLAPVFGFVTRTLGVPRDEALATLLHLGLRGTLSAAVRLGCCDSADAPALYHALRPVLEAAQQRACTLGIADVAHTAPPAERLGAPHGRLYSRSFQS
jgi:urease accessory protein